MNSGRLPGDRRILICGAGVGGASNIAAILAALECRTLLVDREPPGMTPAAVDDFAHMVAVGGARDFGTTSASRGKHHGRHAGAFGGSKS